MGNVIGLRRGFSSPGFDQGKPSEFDQFVGAVIRDVAELPDRNSPEDEPDMMLVTTDELKVILCTRLNEAALGSKLTKAVRYLDTFCRVAQSLPLSPHSPHGTGCKTVEFEILRSRTQKALIDFMSDTPSQSIEEVIAQKEARLAEQAAAIERERAELAELKKYSALFAKHNLIVSAAPSAQDSSKIVTVAELADSYRSDTRSGYHKIRFNVRQNYNNRIKRALGAAGHLRLAEIDAQTIQRLYDQWSAGGKSSQGRALVGVLRLLAGYGVTVLDHDACMRLSSILHKMRFGISKSRAQHLTEAQANAIRAKAHEMGRPSIALGQAFQFDCPLKQTDVIGQWAPLSEPGVSDLIDRVKGKWMRGIRWEAIDDNLILRHVTSMHQKEVEIDLKQAPMVMEELKRLGKRPSRGPVIICEWEGIPWSNNEYRRWWRKLADAAGVPKNVKNMDSIRATGSNENRSHKAPVSL